MFKIFKAEIENQLSKSTKSVRSDLVMNTTADIMIQVNNVHDRLLSS